MSSDEICRRSQKRDPTAQDDWSDGEWLSGMKKKTAAAAVAVAAIPVAMTLTAPAFTYTR